MEPQAHSPDPNETDPSLESVARLSRSVTYELDRVEQDWTPGENGEEYRQIGGDLLNRLPAGAMCNSLDYVTETRAGGVVSYEYYRHVMTTTDRGVEKFTWTNGAASVTRERKFEVEGDSVEDVDPDTETISVDIHNLVVSNVDLVEQRKAELRQTQRGRTVSGFLGRLTRRN